MIAVIVVRDGVLPAGYDETICEAGRNALLVGSRVHDTLAEVEKVATRTWMLELDPADATAGDLARAIAECLDHIAGSSMAPADLGHAVILPASPDGRDLAPHLAFVLDRPFHAGAVSIRSDSVAVSRHGGLHLVDVQLRSPFVATLQIGIRGSEPRDESRDGAHIVDDVTSAVSARTARVAESVHHSVLHSVLHVDVQPPDASTMDLAEAPRIVGGGAGLTDADAFDQLQRIAARLGASMGVTRVITDRGWAEHNRQIGTTGIVVDPDLYISFGISGAVQHTSGLGHPNHIISVNTDAHCPMMQISDVAIVSDANDVLDALETLLAEPET